MKTRMILERPKDRYSKPYDKYDYVAMTIVSIGAMIIALLCGTCSPAHAKELPFTDHEAIIAIYGEALHDYDSMYAIACALRNRHNNLKGVYGRFQAPSGPMYQRASRAWFEAEDGPDVTKGATNWLSDYDLKHCNPERMAWRNWMKETAYIGQTHFYMEV